MTHSHQPTPRWLWPLSAVLVIVIILLAIFAPMTPPCDDPDAAHVDHAGHAH